MAINSEYYDENYAKQLEDGQQYQDFLTRELPSRGIIFQQFSSKKYQYTIGESHSRIEIKYDKQYSKYGNLWIEYQERKYPTGEYINSGILRDDNTFLWAQGDYNTLFIFCKRDLRHKLEHEQYIENKQKTSIGKLLKHPLPDQYCGLKIRFNDKTFTDFDAKLKRVLERKLPEVQNKRNESSLEGWGVS